jgi:hypothetical protein
MLVSSHTISVWVSWDDVPTYIYNSFVERGDRDIVVFVPLIMEKALGVEELLKGLGVGEGKDVVAGVVYVKKGFANEESSG